MTGATFPVCLDELHAHGFAWAAGTFEPAWPPEGPSTPVRDVLGAGAPEWVRSLAFSLELRSVASRVLGRPACAVRANLFVKGPGSNWGVPWHRDRVVCVRERRDVAGFSSWTLKAGLHHANAPLAVLHDMVALRLYLDDSPLDGGPLEVMAGSHRAGLADSALGVSVSLGPRALPARAGAVLAMRPLLVHRSRAQASPRSRRVLHVEFAGDRLPGGLEWHYAPVGAQLIPPDAPST